MVFAFSPKKYLIQKMKIAEEHEFTENIVF